MAEVLTDETIRNEFVAMIGRLDEGDFFSMRIASCHLYAQIYDRLNEEKMEHARTKFERLVKDDTPMVRWGSAQAMSTLVNHLEKSQIESYLLPLLDILLKDKNDSVKVHAVQASVTISKHLMNPKVITQNLIPPLKQAFSNKQSWRLRFAVAENAAAIG